MSVTGGMGRAVTWSDGVDFSDRSWRSAARWTRKSDLRQPPEEIAGVPQLPARFLEPHGFLWGSFAAPDGAKLRWGHLPAANPRVECVMVGGFTECIEKYFETTADLAARGVSA